MIHTRSGRRADWTPAWDLARPDAFQLIAGGIDNGTNGATPPTGWVSTDGTIGGMTGQVIYVEWGSIQAGSSYDPALAGSQLTRIDTAITLFRQTANPKGRLRLRLMSVKQAPPWVRDACGSILVAQTDTAPDIEYDAPQWWVPEFVECLRACYTRLAEYPATIGGTFADHIADVAVTGGNPAYAEPMLIHASHARPSDGQQNHTTYWNAPTRLTGTLQEQAIRDLIDVTAECWPRQYIYMASNPMQRMKDGAASSPYYLSNDNDATQRLNRYHRWRLGRRAVIGNNSWGFDWTASNGNGPAYTDLYAFLMDLGAPVSIQTAATANTKIGDYDRATQQIVRHGFQGVELTGSVENEYFGATVASATCSAGTGANTIVVGSGTPFATGNNPEGQTIVMLTGAAAGQKQLVLTRTSDTQVELASSFSPAPSAGDTFSMRRYSLPGSDGGTGGVPAAQALNRQLAGWRY